MFSGFDNFPTLATLKVHIYFPRLICDFENYLTDYKVAQERIQYILLNCYRYVVTNGKSTYPVFYMCKCNHCTNCLESKKNDLVQRVMVESQSYEYRPLFVTLTYDDEHNDGLLHRKDFIDFMKRLRINAQRFVDKHADKYCLQDSTQTAFRYFACGEYGGKTDRPHFHLCIFNYVVPNAPLGRLHPNVANQSAIAIMKTLIVKSWKNGDSGSHSVRPNGKRGKELDIQFARNCGSYISKYMAKDIKPQTYKHIQQLCDGDAEKAKDYLPFIKYSQGLGRNYFDLFVRPGVTTDTTKFYIKNRLATSQKDAFLEIPLCGYFRNRCFPSISMKYKKDCRFRLMLRDYCLIHFLAQKYRIYFEQGYVRLFYKTKGFNELNVVAFVDTIDPYIEPFMDYFSIVDDTFHDKQTLTRLKNQREVDADLLDLYLRIQDFKAEYMDDNFFEYLDFHLCNCQKLVYDREQHLKNLLSSPRDIIDPIVKYHSILNRQQASTNREMFQLL